MKIDRLYRVQKILDLVQESTSKELPKSYIVIDKVMAWVIGIGVTFFWIWVIYKLVEIYGN